jgi:GR25 family glycosyltransferase involved in LPS biosynthesis
MARILLLLASAALCCADPIKLGSGLNKMREKTENAFEQIQKDLARDISAAKETKAHPKLKVDKWKNCGEPVAYWGEGNDRTQCPCKPDPTKTPVMDTLDKRLELLEKSPEHKWKVNATDVKWKGQFFINLALSTNRREHIETQLKEIKDKHRTKIATHRWAATDPHQAARANLKEFTDQGLDLYVKNMTDREKWGTIGTYLSHLRLLRRIWSNDKDGEGLYAIMEDDGTLDKDWQLKVEKALQVGDIPKDWDIIKFGYWGLTRCEDAVSGGAYEARAPMMLNDGTRKSYYNGNLGYIVRPKSIPAILAAARKQPVFDVDGVFVAMNNEKATKEDYGIHSYYLKHSLVKGGTGGEGLATERLGGGMSQYSLAQKA